MGAIGGYDADTVNQVFGGFDALFLNGVTLETAHSLLPGIPEFLFIAFQMTFAIITPALITGAFAERFKYSALLLFTALWSLLVYAPGANGSLDYIEVKAAGSRAIGPVTAGVAIYYSPDFFGADKDATYAEVNAAFTPADKVTISGAVGEQ